ncbi:MAG: glycosyl hydrolase family 17 protein [Pseudomonadota bacterium]
MHIEHGNAICYSGYREGQSPQTGDYPSYKQICEDLKILANNWSYLRLYDCSAHAETVLRVIQNEKLEFKVMLGVDMAAEVSNPGCPWGAEFDDDTLAKNAAANEAQISRLTELANAHEEHVFAVSVGNEASVDWTDHMVPVERLLGYVRALRACVSQPITFCENYVPWTGKLAPLVAELDFISIHTYPAWEYKHIDDALAYTKDNYWHVAAHYPDKPVVITEAGWTTKANGRGIDPDNASESLQASYYQQLLEWTNHEKILTFVFEAFDEPWKGSEDPAEPEKHWGLFNEDRSPKLVMQPLYGSNNP